MCIVSSNHYYCCMFCVDVYAAFQANKVVYIYNRWAVLVLIPYVEKPCKKGVFRFVFRKFIRTLLREGNRHRACIIVHKVFVSWNT